MNLLVNIYRLALKLLPTTYRDKYAEPMAQTLEDMITDQPSRLSKWKIWSRTMFDLPVTAAIQYTQIGGTSMNDTPRYAKRGTFISALLLLPFIIFILIKSIHPLSKSWDSIGYFSVFILPIIALLVGLSILVKLFLSHDIWSRLKTAKQLQKNWMLFAIPFLAFGMVLFAFGHDSVHCFTRGQLNNAVQCLRNSTGS